LSSRVFFIDAGNFTHIPTAHQTAIVKVLGVRNTVPTGKKNSCIRHNLDTRAVFEDRTKRTRVDLPDKITDRFDVRAIRTLFNLEGNSPVGGRHSN
jgi:hypothetical protein